MNEPVKIHLKSEIGKLNAVVMHAPGAEVENMTPANAERALYSDILNLSIALPEYNQFLEIMKKLTRVFELGELLQETLEVSGAKEQLLSSICASEHAENLCETLMEMDNARLARQLIEGVPMVKDNLTRYLDEERFVLHPLPNFFFTRDASIALNESVIISKMAARVRERESQIMQSIFMHHPLLKNPVISPVSPHKQNGQASIEGGDVLVASENILLIGKSQRTTSQGIDAVIEHLKLKGDTQHIIVQELPSKPESFIHLDMVFTFLSQDKCMIFEPLIMRSSRHLTLHIVIENGKVVSIREQKNILAALKNLGIDMQALYCGGKNDTYIMEREQWQSGANFFAVAPGKLLGYMRNVHTIEELSKNGFEVIEADEVLSARKNPDDYENYVITIKGNELSRGGGGARCMTMPLNRCAIRW